MKCLICGNNFEIRKGSKAQNRKLCYDCIPEGLNKLERDKLYRSLIKNKIDKEKLSRGCDRCGYKKCATALEWHHPNEDKEINPADCLRSNGYKGYILYQEEIKKCNLLCANCHREIHSQE